MLPILHASGFSWDEALVLVAAIAAVPLLSLFTSWMGRRRKDAPTPPPADPPPVDEGQQPGG
jgi:hypothetical protein